MKVYIGVHALVGPSPTWKVYLYIWVYIWVLPGGPGSPGSSSGYAGYRG